MSTPQSGYQTLQAPMTNKGLEFDEQDRKRLRLQGLLPPAVFSPEVSLERCMVQLRSKSTPLEKYIYMQSMQDVNEAMYYRMLIKHTKELMPIVYTPTVGQACQEFSHIYRQTARGLYLPITEAGNIRNILDNWPEEDVKAIVFTDGERILGLGDLGANGMGIPIGKLALYTVCAGVHPRHCLPITIDVGTENEDNLKDPFYIGLRQRRVRGEKYDAFIEEFMQAAVDKYGKDLLLQFEDFGNHNAFVLLKRFQNQYCTFNDDIQGTASVIVSGLISAAPLSNRSLSKHTFMFLGAGEAGAGIAELIALAIHEESGKSIEEARKQIWMVDSKGLVIASRKESLQEHKLNFAHEYTPSHDCKTLVDSIKELKATTLIGVCTIPKSFNKEVCEAMAENCENPIIFALSNPNSKAECTAEEAYNFTKGRCIFASGSPFDPVTVDGKEFVPGQGNNAYVFPGIALGILASGITNIPDDIMLVAARTLAKNVSQDQLNKGCVYPPLHEIRGVSLDIAVDVAEYGYAHGIASKPRPDNLRKHIESLMYSP